MFLLLLGAFTVQTWLIYSDPVGHQAPDLSTQALRGRAIWHDNNCQSCHQIFGYGGFLGPDLTNLASRRGDLDDLDRDLAQVLGTGSQQMPAFPMPPEDTRALAQFFVELDKMGIGQLSISPIPPAHTLWADAIDTLALENPLSPPAQEGRTIGTDLGCINCHLPNTQSTFGATDLTSMYTALSPEHLQAVLADGIPSQGMPAFQLTETRYEAVSAFLSWLSDNQTPLQAHIHASQSASGGSLWDLPWFEYR